MSTVIKDLGAVSAYAYAVEKGYTGTEAEFAELMADYAEVGQRAEDAAESALNSKTAAQTAATTATNKASEATTAAQTATTKAGEAQTSAQTASSKASEASQSASQASGYAQTAETAKTDAQTAKTQAETARDNAVTAKTAAETAQGKAEDAQAAAESVAESIPSDYSQLSEDVSDLKSEITALESDGVAPSAEQLLSDNYVDNSVPYLFRQTGGDGADREYADAIVGGTVAWNQEVINGNFESKSNWAETIQVKSFTVDNNKATLVCNASTDNTYLAHGQKTFISGHKYLISYEYNKSGSSDPIYGIITTYPSGLGMYKTFYSLPASGVNAAIVSPNADATASLRIGLRNSNPTGEWTYTLGNVQCFDLTQALGSTIADYIYSLEQATAGAGVAFFKSLFPNDYYPYNAGELKSVEGVSAHVMRDADSNIIGNYPLDNSLTLRGIPKLADGKMYFDGDRYLPDGKVERRYGIRAYQSGDESLADAITDGTNTVYKLTATNIEEATPYRQLQICDSNGTEEFVSTGIVPVGHETRYPENLRAKIEGLPWDFSSLIAPTEKTTTASRNYTTGNLLIMGNVLYKVTANIANGGTITPNTNVTATTLSEILSALAQ